MKHSGINMVKFKESYVFNCTILLNNFIMNCLQEKKKEKVNTCRHLNNFCCSFPNAEILEKVDNDLKHRI